jgi:hypothetical protein
MINVWIRIYPTLGKEAEVRAFMTDWVKHAQEQGEQVALLQRIYSSEGSVLVALRRYDDLAAADARRRENLADADWQGRVATLNTMIREPLQQTLAEPIVPLVPSTAPVGAVQRAFFFPAPDKIGQMRSLLEEFVRAAHAAGREQVGLSQHIFSATGPVLVITATHADVAALDQNRRDRAAVVQPLVAAAAPLSRAPIAVRLLEVLVPFPR